MGLAYFLALLAAVEAGLATEKIFVGGTVLLGLWALIAMGDEIVKAVKK